MFLTLRAKGFLKERILDVKKSFRIKLESGKSTVNVRKAGLSTEEEVKWLSKRYTWKYIPNRYQALVACIVSGFLYFNIFNVLFSDRSTGDCGSFFRPKLDEEPYALGWIWDTIGSNNVKCSDAYYGGLLWEFYLTFAALAICGLVLRRAIKRENAAKSA